MWLLLMTLLVPAQSEPVFLHPVPRQALIPTSPDPHSFDVRHYRLDIELTMSDAGYRCHEQVEIKSNVSLLDSFTLDFAGLVCDSVKHQGLAVQFDTAPGVLRIWLSQPLPQGESTVVDIFFHREPTAPQIGFFFAQPPTVLHAHAMTCGCPRDNHYWFACWDWPADKAEQGCAINLILPDTFQGCANGMLDSVTVVPGGKRVWWWRHPYPIATYLMTFSASRFARWDTVVTTLNGDTVPLVYFMWPRDSAATRTGYRFVPDMMRYFSAPDRFGAYPFERFGLVPGYYGFPWGGMEHQTQVMLHPSYIGGGGEAIICHELSHMWWGDMVTHQEYADVWLNEGFASWAECLYMGHLNGRSYFQNYIAGKARQYFTQHRSRDFPIYNPPWSEIYNYGIIYCKGSWVLRMLQFVCGDTAWEQPGVFFRALRSYADSFRYGTATTEIFRRIVERETGRDLRQFFEQWVYDRGYPKLRLFWSKERSGDSWDVAVRVVQQNDTNSRQVFVIPFPLQVNCLGESIRVQADVQDSVYTARFRMLREPVGITPDPDNWILDSCYVSQVGVEELAGEVKINQGMVRIINNPSRKGIRLECYGGAPDIIELFDCGGRRIGTFSREQNERMRTVWLAVPNGVYYVRTVLGQQEERLKVVVLN